MKINQKNIKKLEALKTFTTELLMLGIGSAMVILGRDNQTLVPQAVVGIGAVLIALSLLPALSARAKYLFSK